MSSERQELNIQSPWWGEHVQRYKVVIKQLNPTDNILDIACGTGFGSDLLSNHTKGVVIGGDIEQNTINICKQRWKKKNIKFVKMDGTNLPFENNYFDKVVSFETIEHTTQYQEMVSEFARVLKQKGTAYISTPNFIVNSPTGIVTNPYHTQEFVLEEFKALLERYFPNVLIYGQKYIRYEHNGTRNILGKTIEELLYARGIRKIPLRVQDAIMKVVSGNPMYPTATDFILVEQKKDILKCKTFFAICKK